MVKWHVSSKSLQALQKPTRIDEHYDTRKIEVCDITWGVKVPTSQSINARPSVGPLIWQIAPRLGRVWPL